MTGVLLVEQRLRLNDLCWGTADAVVMGNRKLKIIDLKTGSGVKVYAKNNGQGLTYAVMARREWAPIYGPFDTIEIHMVQPPLDHIDVWTITAAELDAFEAQLLEIIARIEAGDQRAHPDEYACMWCKGKAVCRARAEHNTALMKRDFLPPELLGDDEIAAILPQLGQITKWCSDLQEHALKQAERGVSFSGFKLVEGRSNRVWRDEAEAADALQLSGIDEQNLWKRKLIGIGEAEKLLGKSHPLFSEQCSKPRGKPALVPEKDPRPALVSQAGDFTAVE